jgi:hypothetical protein
MSHKYKPQQRAETVNTAKEISILLLNLSYLLLLYRYDKMAHGYVIAALSLVALCHVTSPVEACTCIIQHMLTIISTITIIIIIIIIITTINCVHRSTSATLSRVPVAVPTRVCGRTTAARTAVTSTGRRVCLATVIATGPSVPRDAPCVGGHH